MSSFDNDTIVPPEGVDADTTVITQEPVQPQPQPQPGVLPPPEPKQTLKVYRILDESPVDFHPVLTVFVFMFYGILALFWYVPAYLSLAQLTYTGDFDRAKALSAKVERVSWILLAVALSLMIVIVLFGAFL